MKDNRVLSLVSLATRAGKTVSGEFATEKSVKSGHARMVILSEEASGNTRKKFTDLCSFYGVPLCFVGDGEALGKSAGKEFRISLALEDEGFAQAVSKALAEDTGENLKML